MSAQKIVIDCSAQQQIGLRSNGQPLMATVPTVTVAALSPAEQAEYDARQADRTHDWAELRRRRNALLAQSDWTQVADAPLDALKKTAWATYRQQLRDLPALTLDPRQPAWPTPPA